MPPETTAAPVKNGKGKKADDTPNKVFTPSVSRADDGTLNIDIPFNDQHGVRQISKHYCEARNGRVEVFDRD